MGLEIAGWFASAALARLADAISSYIGKQYEYQSGAGIRSKLQNLGSNMTKIGAAIHEADQRQIENPGLKKWLLELKDACYDAEDVIDMFDYQLLKDKANGKNQENENMAIIPYRHHQWRSLLLVFWGAIGFVIILERLFFYF